MFSLPALAGRHWRAPSGWLKGALCVHRHESVDWHRRTDWRGYPSRDRGGMQIDVGTWAAYAPRGFPADPADASPAEQLQVAFAIWLRDGWAPWPNSSKACGLR